MSVGYERAPEIRPDVVQPFLDAHPYERFFLTVSGAHLYGFASADSDYDLRGSHIIPAVEMLGLTEPRATYEVLDREAVVETDLVTHDVLKFFRMLVKKNGYALEQVCSPLIIEAHPAFEEFRGLALRTTTRYHHFHFASFASKQWHKVSGSSHGTVKGLLYTYRPLLAGIHLMRTGEVESSLVVLNEIFGLTYLDDLMARKRAGAERQPLRQGEMSYHEDEFERLRGELDEASRRSPLPAEVPESTIRSLEGLLLRLRGVG